MSQSPSLSTPVPLCTLLPAPQTHEAPLSCTAFAHSTFFAGSILPSWFAWPKTPLTSGLDINGILKSPSQMSCLKEPPPPCPPLSSRVLSFLSSWHCYASIFVYSSLPGHCQIPNGSTHVCLNQYSQYPVGYPAPSRYSCVR